MSFDMVISLISNLEIVFNLTPCNRTSNVVTLLESSDNFNWGLTSIYFQYLNNISASQIEQYFGFCGLE